MIKLFKKINERALKLALKQYPSGQGEHLTVEIEPSGNVMVVCLSQGWHYIIYPDKFDDVHTDFLEERVNAFLTNEKQKELVDLFKNPLTK